jgi:apoptosis-stimulating of p53 protein 2
VVKVPPPVPTKPKQINLPYFGQTNQSPSDIKPDGNPQQMPAAVTSIGNKPKPVGQQPRVLLSPSVPSGGQDQILSSVTKQESPPAVAVRPFTPQPSKDTLLPAFRKPQTVAASSIYSMYTQHQAPGKNFQQAVQSALTKTHPRGPHFASGKVLGFIST